MKRILFTFALSVLCTAVWGRAYRGRVFTEGNIPVEFANIVLLKSDSTFVNGVVSDKNGSFEIPYGGWVFPGAPLSGRASIMLRASPIIYLQAFSATKSKLNLRLKKVSTFLISLSSSSSALA